MRCEGFQHKLGLSNKTSFSGQYRPKRGVSAKIDQNCGFFGHGRRKGGFPVKIDQNQFFRPKSPKPVFSAKIDRNHFFEAMKTKTNREWLNPQWKELSSEAQPAALPQSPPPPAPSTSPQPACNGATSQAGASGSDRSGAPGEAPTQTAPCLTRGPANPERSRPASTTRGCRR